MVFISLRTQYLKASQPSDLATDWKAMCLGLVLGYRGDKKHFESEVGDTKVIEKQQEREK